jgi:hypothetical protein
MHMEPGLRTLADFAFEGKSALRAILATSPYRSAEQAVAALTMFTHPDTVRRLGAGPVFRIVRGPIPERGRVITLTDGPAMQDDNKGPTDAFLWANGLRLAAGHDLQFNHVWGGCATDVACYTNLANLAVGPAFLAKLTDTDGSIAGLLRYRSFELFGWTPPNASRPERPTGYDSLTWAPPLRAVADPEAALRTAMRTKPKDRTVTCARTLGWACSQFRPDAKV